MKNFNVGDRVRVNSHVPSDFINGVDLVGMLGTVINNVNDNTRYTRVEIDGLGEKGKNLPFYKKEIDIVVEQAADLFWTIEELEEHLTGVEGLIKLYAAGFRLLKDQ